MSLKWQLAALFTVATLFGKASGVVPPPAVPFFCSLNEIQCPSRIKHCIQPLELCNGIVNCPDGSDENATFCKAYDCSAKDPPTIPPYPYPAGGRPPVYTNKKCPSGNMCTMASINRKADEFTWATPWLCDGVKHCADGSDENVSYCQKLHRDMAAKNCTVDTPGVYDAFVDTQSFFHDDIYSIVGICPSRTRCVLKDKLCNGKKDCPDGSDEWPSFCKTFNCPSTTSFRCKDWGCLTSDNQICNGVKNCADGSDEDPAFCATYKCPVSNGKKCSNNRTCLPQSQVCDGSWTCPDGSDEKPSICRYYKCTEGRYKCKDGIQCSGVSEVRDQTSRTTTCSGPIGEPPTCKDKSDAFNGLCRFPPPGPSGINCASRGFDAKCPSGVGCLYKSQLCDGAKDCSDGSDEGQFCKTYNCSSKASNCGFLGSLGDLAPLMCKKNLTCTCGLLCNGWVDCKDKSDEDPAFCSTYKCPPGFRKCPNNKYQCVLESALCDGAKDCSNGGDEEPSLCKNFKCQNEFTSVECAKNAYRCLADSRLCDGAKDCVNGGDEAPAFCKTFKCPAQTTKLPYGKNSFQCVYDGWLCDGFPHGIDGCDENPAFCKNHKCGENLTKCPNSPTYQCVATAALCDGTKNCIKDGADENPTFCKNFTRPA